MRWQKINNCSHLCAVHLHCAQQTTHISQDDRKSIITHSRLVIGTSRTVGSAKKFVTITSGFGGGELTKTLRKVCTCQKLKFPFLLLEYCKIRECYACIVYCCIWSVTLAKSIVPRKTWRKLWHSYISKLFLTKMQVKFSIFFHRGRLNVIRDKFRFVRSKLKSR